MDEEEQEEFIDIMNNLQDLVNLIAILEGIVDRLREDANEILKHMREENGDKDIGFDKD